MPRNKQIDSIENYNVTYKRLDGFLFEYYITDDGRVWTNNRKNGIERFMRPHLNKCGYPTIGLIRLDGKQGQYTIHRLVANAFIENPDGKPFINHKDGDRTNNSVSNLEWCTQKENVHHAIHVLHRWSSSEKQRMAASAIGKSKRKLTLDEARQIKRLYGLGNISMSKLGNQFGLSRPCVSKIIHGESYAEAFNET